MGAVRLLTEERLKRAAAEMLNRGGPRGAFPEGLLYEIDPDCCVEYMAFEAHVRGGSRTWRAAAEALRDRVRGLCHLQLTEDLDAQRKLRREYDA
jgi:hypothetical protein